MALTNNQTIDLLKTTKDNFEPGAARFGNFINYYNFNSVSKRLEVLPSDILLQLQLKQKPIVCLDIGCNSGELTVAFYSHLVTTFSQNSEIFMLGIDVDNILITRCQDSNKHVDHLTFKTINVMDESASTQLESYLHQYNKTQFDIITCFSTTMWIHLNYGDSGLNTFLNVISRLAKYFIIEPQEWKCYRSVARRMRRLKSEEFLIKQLQIKNIFEHLLKYLSHECNMHLKTCLGETSWSRKMYLFQNSKCIL